MCDLRVCSLVCLFNRAPSGWLNDTVAMAVHELDVASKPTIEYEPCIDTPGTTFQRSKRLDVVARPCCPDIRALGSRIWAHGLSLDLFVILHHNQYPGGPAGYKVCGTRMEEI